MFVSGLGTNLLTSTAAPPPSQPGNILLLPPTSATGTLSPNQPLLVPLSANTDKIHTTAQAEATTHLVKDVTKMIVNFHFNDDTEKMGFMKEKLDTVLEDCKSIIQASMTRLIQLAILRCCGCTNHSVY